MGTCPSDGSPARPQDGSLETTPGSDGRWPNRVGFVYRAFRFSPWRRQCPREPSAASQRQNGQDRPDHQIVPGQVSNDSLQGFSAANAPLKNTGNSTSRAAGRVGGGCRLSFLTRPSGSVYVSATAQTLGRPPSKGRQHLRRWLPAFRASSDAARGLIFSVYAPLRGQVTSSRPLLEAGRRLQRLQRPRPSSGESLKLFGARKIPFVV